MIRLLLANLNFVAHKSNFASSLFFSTRSFASLLPSTNKNTCHIVYFIIGLMRKIISPNLVLCGSVAAEGQWNIKASHRPFSLFNSSPTINVQHEHAHTRSLFWNRISILPWGFPPNVWHLFAGHVPSCFSLLTKLFSWASAPFSHACWSQRLVMRDLPAQPRPLNRTCNAVAKTPLLIPWVDTPLELTRKMIMEIAISGSSFLITSRCISIKEGESSESWPKPDVLAIVLFMNFLSCSSLSKEWM